MLNYIDRMFIEECRLYNNAPFDPSEAPFGKLRTGRTMQAQGVFYFMCETVIQSPSTGSGHGLSKDGGPQ